MQGRFKPFLTSVVLVFVLWAMVGGAPYTKDLMLRSATLATAALGVCFFLRNSGELSFCHSLFFAAGAYCFALNDGSESVGGVLALFAMMIVVVVLLAALVSAMTARLRGVYFTIATLCIGEGARVVVAQGYSWSGGDNGIQGIDAPRFLTLPSSAMPVVVSCLLLVLGGLFLLERTQWCSKLNACRQNGVRAGSIAIWEVPQRAFAFVFSAIPAGVGGFLAAVYDQSAHPDMAAWAASGDLIAMALLGALTTAGTLVAAYFFVGGKATLASYTDYWALWIGAVALVGGLLWARARKEEGQ